MENNLINIKSVDVDNDFVIDMRYATDDNFTGKRVYKSSECYIDKDTAMLLIKAKDLFKKDGYRIKIWDAYRPISAQVRFHELVKDDNFVATPPDMNTIKEFKASHLNGMCVDITLTDMDGNEIHMPSKFDEFSDLASLDCDRIDKEARHNAEYLKSVMVSVGFKPLSSEWWHFYDKTNPPKRYLDIIF